MAGVEVGLDKVDQTGTEDDMTEIRGDTTGVKGDSIEVTDDIKEIPVVESGTDTDTVDTENLVATTDVDKDHGKEASKNVNDDAEDSLVKEGLAEVFSPSHVFYNPVQQFNRDLTITIMTQYAKDHFSQIANKKKERKDDAEVSKSGTAHLERPCNMAAGQTNDGPVQDEATENGRIGETPELVAGQQYEDGIRILEGLAATGLRSIRFALEVPGVREIVCNDYDETAVDYVRRNCDHNQVGHLITPSQADAAALLHRSKARHSRFHVIDLDPYGTAAPFLDGAVQALVDGGLLCVTCTDVAVLCGGTPTACHARYGSVSLRAPFRHEMALRILLRSIESHANRYGRYISPVVAVSVDFYVRVFVRVYTGRQHANASAARQSLVFHCVGCGSYTLQPLASHLEGTDRYVPAVAPTTSPACPHCSFRQHIGGPIWSDPLHDVQFISRLTEKGGVKPTLGTAQRVLGMLHLMREELADVPLFYVTDELCRVVHCTAPTLLQIRSTLLNAGYEVSLSHAAPNSVKTNAPNSVLWDIVRCWVKLHPVSKKRLHTGSAALFILSQPPTLQADFTLHPKANPESRVQGLLRWQANPERDWGPMPRAKVGDTRSLEQRRQDGMARAHERRQRKRKGCDNTLLDNEEHIGTKKLASEEKSER